MNPNGNKSSQTCLPSWAQRDVRTVVEAQLGKRHLGGLSNLTPTHIFLLYSASIQTRLLLS